MATINKKKFAKAIKEYRTKNDLTLYELATKIPTTLNTVFRWESGRGTPRSQLLLNRLRELGVKF